MSESSTIDVYVYLTPHYSPKKKSVYNCVCMCMYVCMYVCMRMYVCMYVWMYVCVCVCVCVLAVYNKAQAQRISNKHFV